MTIKYETLATGATRLADHRAFENRNVPEEYRSFRAVSPITIFDAMPSLSFGESEMVFAQPVDPDTIEIRRLQTGPFGQIPTFETIGTVTREAINFANITDGKVKAVWSPTGPEDYPLPPEGYTLIENS